MTEPLSTPELDAGPDAKQLVVMPVAAAILIKPSGELLLTSRPRGKGWAGYWEFPGGKIEPGESPAQALSRELFEELGITCNTVVAWRSTLVHYPKTLVQLHCFKVPSWSGQLQMREGQRFSWQRLPVNLAPLLPSAHTLLDWLAAENQP